MNVQDVLIYNEKLDNDIKELESEMNLLINKKLYVGARKKLDEIIGLRAIVVKNLKLEVK